MKKAFILFAIVLLMTGCIQLEAPKANYRDVRVTNVTLSGVQLDFIFDVQNKNPISVEIPKYDYKVHINGRELVSNTGGGLGIDANSSKMLTIPVNVRWDRVFDSVASIAANILSGNMYLDYRIEGSITAGTTGLTATAPLSAAGRIPIPKEALRI